MPIVNEKIKCPKCEKLIQKKVVLANEGRCVYCGYLIATPLLNFANGKKTIQQ
jgi:acetyl-CoA carboxylase beta subunit